jgi:hypothetical protein
MLARTQGLLDFCPVLCVAERARSLLPEQRRAALVRLGTTAQRGPRLLPLPLPSAPRGSTRLLEPLVRVSTLVTTAVMSNRHADAVFC